MSMLVVSLVIMAIFMFIPFKWLVIRCYEQTNDFAEPFGTRYKFEYCRVATLYYDSFFS